MSFNNYNQDIEQFYNNQENDNDDGYYHLTENYEEVPMINNEIDVTDLTNKQNSPEEYINYEDYNQIDYYNEEDDAESGEDAEAGEDAEEGENNEEYENNEHYYYKPVRNKPVHNKSLPIPNAHKFTYNKSLPVPSKKNKSNNTWLYIILVILLIALIIYYVIDNKLIKIPKNTFNPSASASSSTLGSTFMSLN